MASRAKGSLTPTAATVDALVSAIVTGGIEYDDVVKALNFDKVDFAVLLRVGEYRRYSIGDTVRYSNFE